MKLLMSSTAVHAGQHVLQKSLVRPSQSPTAPRHSVFSAVVDGSGKPPPHQQHASFATPAWDPPSKLPLTGHPCSSFSSYHSHPSPSESSQPSKSVHVEVAQVPHATGQ